MEFDCVPIHFSDTQQMKCVTLCMCTHTTHTQTFHPSVAPSDYDARTNFLLGPFSDGMRQRSFNVSIVNDAIPEDAEMFRVSLTVRPADQARLGNRVTVSPDEATVTINDNDGRHCSW